MWFDVNGDVPRWYAVGIVSFGLSRCAQANSAGVYTRFVLLVCFIHQFAYDIFFNDFFVFSIDKYIDWMLDKMKYFE